MNYDEVVNLIVDEIYKKLNKDKTFKKQLKKTAIVMTENNINEIKRTLEGDYEILIYGKDLDLIEADLIIIPTLSLKAMANLATLVTDEVKEEFIVRMLMMGKEVYVLENGLEYRRYKNTAPKALYSKYLDFEQQIKLNGIQVIGYIGEVKKNSKNLLEDIESCEEVKEITSISSRDMDLRNRKAINELEIKNRIVPSIETIIIDKKSIITPLAADFIKTHNLRVKRV